MSLILKNCFPVLSSSLSIEYTITSLPLITVLLFMGRSFLFICTKGTFSFVSLYVTSISRSFLLVLNIYQLVSFSSSNVPYSCLLPLPSTSSTSFLFPQISISLKNLACSQPFGNVILILLVLIPYTSLLCHELFCCPYGPSSAICFHLPFSSNSNRTHLQELIKYAFTVEISYSPSRFHIISASLDGYPVFVPKICSPRFSLLFPLISHGIYQFGSNQEPSTLPSHNLSALRFMFSSIFIL